MIFLDRFNSEESVKRLVLTSNDSIYFKSWSFQDSTACMNAFYNLLDCFGKVCSPIELYSTDFIASNYNLILVLENQIHSINSKENQDSKFGIDILKLKITFLNIITF